MTLSRRHILKASAAAACATGASSLALAQTPPSLPPSAPAPAKPAPGLPTPGIGERLFSHVQGYAKWPQHRTGSDEARETAAWFETALRQHGAEVSRWSYDFPRYDCQARLTVGGRTIETLPLWYEGTGEVATDDPFLRPVTLLGNADKRDLDAALQEARRDRARLAVLATFSEFDDAQRRPVLIACDADPEVAATGIPTLLISGADLDGLAGATLSAVFSAKRVPARAENVLARFGTGEKPILIGVPLTSWFTAAGERGSAIAIAIELAAEIAREMPVAVLGVSGQELGHLGLKRQLQAGLDVKPRAALHLGACVAAGSRGADGLLKLSAFRFATATRPMVEGSALHQALQAAELSAAPDAFGEGAVWAKALGPDVPLLSIAGSFPHYHTPADTPEASTSPPLLAQVHEALRQAVAQL